MKDSTNNCLEVWHKHIQRLFSDLNAKHSQAMPWGTYVPA
ncbi:hypothetical protein AHF37_10110 [Paragonimus kellicotti]|nr:hypothetical protein AHF37_10110 [Paragonimus kellicotti]